MNSRRGGGADGGSFTSLNKQSCEKAVATLDKVLCKRDETRPPNRSQNVRTFRSPQRVNFLSRKSIKESFGGLRLQGPRLQAIGGLR